MAELTSYLAVDKNGCGLYLSPDDVVLLPKLVEQGFTFYIEGKNGELTEIAPQDMDLSLTVVTQTFDTPSIAYVDDRTEALLDVIEILAQESSPVMPAMLSGVSSTLSTTKSSASVSGSSSNPALTAALEKAIRLIKGGSHEGDED